MILNSLKRLALIFILLIVAVQAAYASEQFAVDISVQYKIMENGTTQVTHNVSLENLYSEYFAKSYSLTLENIEPLNARAFEGSNPLSLTSETSNNLSILKIEFDKPTVGKGAARSFTVAFEEKDFVSKTGEVWEVSIPRLSDIDSFRNYSVELFVPQSFGGEAYISPEPQKIRAEDGFVKYSFENESAALFGISAGYGAFQVFNFTLKYHLENPLGSSAVTQIALPPDTAFQKMYYEKVEPRPVSMITDLDGNWIASYELKARERIDVIAVGSVQIFSEPRDDLPAYSDKLLQENLKESAYWQSRDPKIISLANSLKTPRAIYNYVSRNLGYDYSRVNPNVVRQGALLALKNPSSAICMEFTDLFIALARASGIPAREVNGYAYTENPEIEPLSLVADVLHAWPEYWDSELQIWVPVDPTWGNTTGGVNFFDNLDLRHFTFVVHGVDAQKPYPAGSYKLGTNPEKDVFVSFGKLPEVRSSSPQIFSRLEQPIPLFPPKVVVEVANEGPSAIYNLDTQVYFDNEIVQNETIERLLPFSRNISEIKVPYSFLSINMPLSVRVFAGNASLDVPTGKESSIVYNLVALILIVIVVVIVALIRLKKLKLPLNVTKFKKNKGEEGFSQKSS